MPQVLSQPTEKAEPPTRWIWTRRDCEDFEARGLLTPGKYELVEGEIIRKMPQKPPHSISIGRVFAWCLSIFGVDFVQTQGTVDVSPEDNPTSQPQPDIFVLKSLEKIQTALIPTPDDLSLLIEVSDSTLAFDLSTKAGMYARAGIRDYWVIDVSGRALTVHRDPNEGRFQSVVRYAADESVSPLEKPEARVIVSRLLPPLPTGEPAASD